MDDLRIEADLIVLAVGQSTTADALGLKTEKNEVPFDGYQVEGKVFVTGDLARGDKTVVWAVKKAKEAAAAIDAYLEGR